MIKQIQFDTQEKLDEVVTLWLKANIEAHSFISETYWIQQLPLVKEQLPYANLYGYYDPKNNLLGFIGLNATYIEGLFVKKEARNQSIGTQLINIAKLKQPSLTLLVYCKNQQAVRFYLRNSFKIIETVLEDNEQTSYKMSWSHS